MYKITFFNKKYDCYELIIHLKEKILFLVNILNNNIIINININNKYNSDLYKNDFFKTLYNCPIFIILVKQQFKLSLI